MNKSIVLIALCVLISTIAFVHGADVEIKFVNDYLVRNGYNPVEITFSSKVNLAHDVTWSAQATDADDKATPPVIPNKVYAFTETADYLAHPEGPLIGALANSYCLDTTTKQYVGTLEVTSGTTFAFTYADDGNYAAKYTADGPFAATTVRCLLALDTQVAVDYFNLRVNYYDGPTAITSLVDWLFAFPSKGYITPHVDFKSLSFGADLSRPDASSTVEFEFSTDTVGVYRIGSVNAPGFTDRDFKSGDLMPLWCSSGSNKKFARIQSGGTVFVLEVPAAKSSIKCKLYFDTSALGDFVRSQRSSITIDYADISVARTLDFKFTPGVIGATLDSSSTTTTVSVQANYLEYSSTPVNTNSTIEFSFSKQFDVSQLVLTADEQEYRKYTCAGISGATIFVEGGSNKIVLKDVKVSDYTTFSCDFTFTGSDTFAYDNQAKMGSVGIKIDGKSLISGVSNSNQYPIYLRAAFKLSKISHEQTLNGEEYSILDVFSIKDTYPDRHVTPTEPIVLLQLGGVSTQDFSYENHASQLSCTLSTPTDSKPVEAKFVFDEATLSWSLPLKDVVNLETFDLSLQCTRKQRKLVKNGLEITPNTQLTLQVIDLIDGKRYYDYTDSFIAVPMDTIVQPTEPPSGLTLPAKPVWYSNFGAEVLLKTTFNNDDRKAALQYLQSTVSDIVPKAKSGSKDTDPSTFDGFKFTAAPGAASWGLGSGIYNFNATGTELVQHYAEKIALEPYIPFTVTVPTAFSRIENTAPSYAGDISQTSLSMADYWMVVDVPTDKTALMPAATFAATYSIWDSELAKVVSNDFIFKSQPSATAASNHRASPITKCGYVDGAAFEITEAADEEFKWTKDTARNYEVNTIIKTHRCDIDEACTVNADCANVDPYQYTVCKASKCVGIPKTLSKYIQIANSLTPSEPPYNIKKYYNSSSAVSAVVAFVAIIAALLF